ncbi:MAG: cyclic nucleotide-binding domain-containing protein [Bacteroidales bacterium]|jgi:zinc transporter ZupT|nr:cyclic nucleotide-binding domain-containing protein [Bacteroidales bacterium]
MTSIIELDAFLFGIISAVALPLGAILAFNWTPKPKVLASMMAIGAGALLAALTIDLVAVSVGRGHFYPLAVGMITGGIFYVLLNKIVNSRGGFLRKKATTLTHIMTKQNSRQKLLFKQLSKVSFFNSLRPSQVQQIVPYMHRFHYRQGKIMVHEGDPGDLFFVIESGEAIVMDDRNNSVTGLLKTNDTYGIVELMTGITHNYNVIVKDDMHVWIINKESLDRVISFNPALAGEIRDLVNNKIHLLELSGELPEKKAQEWYSEALEHFEGRKNLPTQSDVDEEVAEHGNPSLAIWMGIMLDGIPESIVIGSSLLLHPTMSLSLLAGLFLSNFPEALSSSVGMKKQKMSNIKILLMWSSIMFITGIGAFAGNVFFENVSHGTFALVDGMAAGAMLTMIAETMLPEAYHIGGSVTGLATLGGFLATLLFKVIGN